MSAHHPIIYWFKIFYPNVTLNRDDGTFFLQYVNGVQGTKPDGRQWNRLIDTVVTIIKYNESTIYHDIYINVFSDRTVPYITVSTDDVINTTNNETAFTEVTGFLKNTLR